MDDSLLVMKQLNEKWSSEKLAHSSDNRRRGKVKTIIVMNSSPAVF